MPLVTMPGMRPVRMGDLAAEMARGDDGAIIVRSRAELDAYPRSLIDRLDHWALEAPDRTFLADRGAHRLHQHVQRVIAAFVMSMSAADAAGPQLQVSSNASIDASDPAPVGVLHRML